MTAPQPSTVPSYAETLIDRARAHLTRPAWASVPALPLLDVPADLGERDPDALVRYHAAYDAGREDARESRGDWPRTTPQFVPGRWSSTPEHVAGYRAGWCDAARAIRAREEWDDDEEVW